MQACVLLRGNAFAHRAWLGWPGAGLLPLNPDNVQVKRTSSGLVYDYEGRVLHLQT